MSGAPCAVHPERTLSEVCARCGNFACPECATARGAERYCVECRDRMPSEHPIAWEHERQKLGVVRAYFATTLDILARPDRFMEHLPREGRVAAALGFAIFGSVIFGIIHDLIETFVLGERPWKDIAPAGTEHWFMIGLFVLYIPIAALGVVVNAAIFHLPATMVGARGGFDATFRVVCYAIGATAMVGAIPKLGFVVMAVAQLRICYLGFRAVHELTSGKAVLVLLLPALACGAPFVALALLF